MKSYSICTEGPKLYLILKNQLVEEDFLPAIWYRTGFNLKKVLATIFYAVSDSLPAWIIKENYTDV